MNGGVLSVEEASKWI